MADPEIQRFRIITNPILAKSVVRPNCHQGVCVSQEEKPDIYAARPERDEQRGYAPASPVDTGSVEAGRVSFPAWRDDADLPSAPPPAPMPPDARIGFAVVGLGRLSLEQIIPAFRSCVQARLVALVSGRPDKLAAVAAQHGIAADRCYSYEQFDRLRDAPDVQAVYIVLPNAMHREYTERAAAAGKHVLCEKPMSVSPQDAQAMVAACADAGVKLMVAYRIHYEAYNRRLKAMATGGDLGRLVAFHGVNTQTVAPNGAEQWRHKMAMAGGGSLVDIGLYCLNTARFLIGEEPTEVYATSHSPVGDPRFAEVEETIAFTLRFPGGAIATCLTSYGARDDKAQRLNGALASVEMTNAYQYRGQRMTVTSRRGDATGRDEIELAPNNQFAAEIDHLAECILHDRVPDTPGEEGVRDHRIMAAIYESARLNRPIGLATIPPAPAGDR